MPMDKFDDIIRKKVEAMTFESNEAEVDSIVQSVRHARPSLFKQFMTSRIGILCMMLGLSLLTNMYFIATRSTQILEDNKVDHMAAYHTIEPSSLQEENTNGYQALATDTMEKDKQNIETPVLVNNAHGIISQSYTAKSKKTSTTRVSSANHFEKDQLNGWGLLDETQHDKVEDQSDILTTHANLFSDNKQIVPNLDRRTLKSLDCQYNLPRKLFLQLHPIIPLGSIMKKTFIGLEAAASPMSIQSSVIGQWDVHKNVSILANMGLGLSRNINFNNIADYEDYHNETIASKYNHNFNTYKEVRDMAEHRANIFVGLGVLYRNKIVGEYNGIGGVSGQLILRSKTYLDFVYKTSDVSNAAQARVSSSESNDKLLDFKLQLGVERQLGRYRFQLMATGSTSEQHERHHMEWNPGLMARVLYGL